MAATSRAAVLQDVVEDRVHEQAARFIVVGVGPRAEAEQAEDDRVQSGERKELHVVFPTEK